MPANPRLPRQAGRLTRSSTPSPGIMLLAPFNDKGHDDPRRMIEANLLGAITVTEVFLDQLVDGGGDLINLSSVAGRTARSGNAVYAATKWGLNGWSESLRQELQPGVRVIVIEPGAVAIELTDNITNPEVKQGSRRCTSSWPLSPKSSPSPSPAPAHDPQQPAHDKPHLPPRCQSGRLVPDRSSAHAITTAQTPLSKPSDSVLRAPRQEQSGATALACSRPASRPSGPLPGPSGENSAAACRGRPAPTNGCRQPPWPPCQEEHR